MPLRLRTTVLCAVLAASALPALQTAAADTAAPVLGPLRVEGNRIVDAGGAEVVLRGLHRDGTQGGPSTSPAVVTAGEVDAMTGTWASTVVRVPVGAAQWTGACPALADDAEAYRAGIDAEVRRITTAGAVALVDLHTSTAGCTSIDRHAMPDAPVVTQFWSDAARHFRDDPLVAFELYNEPHFVSDDVWLHGTAGATQQDCDVTVPPSPDPVTRAQQRLELTRCQLTAPRYQAVGMQDLYDLVSRTAPGHLVVVNTPGYSASVPSVRVRATAGNLVYALHPYTCSVPGDACNTQDQARAPRELLQRWTALAATAPVLVTEFGWPVHPRGDGQDYVDGAQYYRETIAFLEQQSPRWGWVAFAFDGSTGGGFSLLDSTTTYAPNSTGQVVFDALHAAS